MRSHQSGVSSGSTPSSRRVLNATQGTTGLLAIPVLHWRSWSTSSAPMSDHLDSHSILSPFQHGFRSKHSCEQLLLTVHDIASIHDNNIRWTSEFWTSRRSLMWFPIREYWTNLITMASTAVYTHGLALSLVVVNGHKFKPAPVAPRVPQGAVLGPLFFLFINYVPSAISPQTIV